MMKNKRKQDYEYTERFWRAISSSVAELGTYAWMSLSFRLYNPVESNSPNFRKFFANFEEKFAILQQFWRFGDEFYKNRALKTLAQNLKSGSENPKP